MTKIKLLLLSSVFLIDAASYAGLVPTNSQQSTRLRITNQCDKTIWIQQDFKNKTNDPVVLSIPQGSSYDYDIPDAGLASTRFWPKSGCNSYGYDCSLGESTGVPDAEARGYQHGPYAPDINSKFEATWGCLSSIYNYNPALCARNPSSPANALGSETWWNGSAVDGYTLPYAINVKNHNSTCKDSTTGQSLTNPGVNCGQLSASSCPTMANLSTEGKFNTINGVSVTNVNLQWLDPKTQQPAGCFSPCSKLTTAQGSDNGSTKGGWRTVLGGLTPQSPEAQMYCCPTPPIFPGVCSAGPAARSSYALSVHSQQQCDAYTYAYDDAKGLARCGAEAQFEITFCPKSIPQPQPQPLPVPPTPPVVTGLKLQFNLNTSVGISAYINGTAVVNAQAVDSGSMPKSSVLTATQAGKNASCNLTLNTDSVEKGSGELCTRLNIVKASNGVVNIYLPADIPNMGTTPMPTPTPTPTTKKIIFGMASGMYAYFNNEQVVNGSQITLSNVPNSQNLNLIAYQNQKNANCIFGKTGEVLNIVPNSGVLCNSGLVLVTEPNGNYYIGLPNTLPETNTSKLYGLGIASGMSVTVNGQVIQYNSANKLVTLPSGISSFTITGKTKLTRVCPITRTNDVLSWPSTAGCQGIVYQGAVIYFPAF